MDKRTILFVILVTLTFYGINYFFSSKTKQETKQWIAQKEEVTAPIITDSNEEFLDEEFYVLENDYQQLVFSTRGGALAEINLPLQSKEDSKSPIHPIQTDRIIQEKYPQNDYFPHNGYLTVTDQGVQSFSKGEKGGFYPLLRRTVYHPNGTISHAVDPKFYALNIQADDSQTATEKYTVKRFEKNLIEFELSQPNRRIVKIFTLSDKAPYVVDLKILVEGDRRGLWLSSGVLEVELISNKAAPALKYELNKGKKPTVEKIKLPDNTNLVTSVYPNWVSNSNGFFGVIIDPLSNTGSGFMTQKINGNIVPPRISMIDPEYKLHPAQNYPAYLLSVPLSASNSSMDFRIYAGPYEGDFLEKVDQIYSNPTTGYNPNYIGAQSFHGWFSFISEPFAKFLFLLMNFFQKITGSWGFSIILLTIVLRLMLYPLNAWSFKTTARMQELAPLTKSIQEKYKKILNELKWKS